MLFSQIQALAKVNVMLVILLQLASFILFSSTILSTICSKSKKPEKVKDTAAKGKKEKHLAKASSSPPKQHQGKGKTGAARLNKEKKDGGGGQPEKGKAAKEPKDKQAAPKASTEKGKKDRGGVGGSKGIATAQQADTMKPPKEDHLAAVMTAHPISTATAHQASTITAKAVPLAPPVVVVPQMDLPVGSPYWQYVGNIDEEIAKKTAINFAEGLGPRHAFDQASQKQKIRKPKAGKDVELHVTENILYVSDDASKTKSLTK